MGLISRVSSRTYRKKIKNKFSFIMKRNSRHSKEKNKLATSASDFIPKTQDQTIGLEASECHLIDFVTERFEIPEPHKDPNRIKFEKYKVVLRKIDLEGLIKQKQSLVIGFFTDDDEDSHNFENLTAVPNLDIRIVNDKRRLNISNLTYDVDEKRWVATKEFIEIGYTLQLPEKVGDRACYQFPIFIRNIRKNKRKRYFQILRVRHKNVDVEELSNDLEGLQAQSRNISRMPTDETNTEPQSLFHTETIAQTEPNLDESKWVKTQENSSANITTRVDTNGDQEQAENISRCSTEQLITQEPTINPNNTETRDDYIATQMPSFSNVDHESTRIDFNKTVDKQETQNDDPEALIEIALTQPVNNENIDPAVQENFVTPARPAKLINKPKRVNF